MRFVPLAVDEAGFRSLVEELRFRFRKWDVYVGGRLRLLPEALTLARSEHEETVAIARSVAAALARVETLARRDPAWSERLAIHPAVRELVEAEVEHPLSIARYDLVPTTEGWMIPEANEDAPGGFNESIASNALFASALGRGRVEGDFAQAFLAAAPPGRRCGLVYATGYAEDLAHVLVLADLLRGRGVEPILASPDQLRCGRFGRPRLDGRPIDWILRFFPAEWFPHVADLRAWRRAMARIPIVNPIGRAVRQSKALFAWWRESSAVAPEDRAILDRHAPRTERFSSARIDGYRAARETLVLKRVFGRMGDSVVLGRRTPESEWLKLLELAAREPSQWIVQQAFTPRSVPTACGSPQFPVVGVYLVNGAFAGHYSRADEVGLTTHEAHHVVTAVEDA